MGVQIDTSNGIEKEALMPLLNGKYREGWGVRETAALRSTMGGSQWTQQRLAQAGLAEEGACQLCKAAVARWNEHRCRAEWAGEEYAGNFVGASWCSHGQGLGTIGHEDEEETNARRRRLSEGPLPWCSVRGGPVEQAEPVLSYLEQRIVSCQPKVLTEVGVVPLGTLTHRHWMCPWVWEEMKSECRTAMKQNEWMHIVKLRMEAQEAWCDHWEHGSGVDQQLWDRAMTAAASAGDADLQREGSFHWYQSPVDDEAPCGDIFVDASMLDGPSKVTGRLGWAFVVAEPGTTNVIASAYGTPPYWVEEVSHTEAWATLEAVRNSFIMQSTLTTDCKSVLDVLKGGKKKATSHVKPMARFIKAVLLPFLSLKS